LSTYEIWKDTLSRKKPSEVIFPGSVEGTPELEAIIGLAQDPQAHPEGDVWTHTILVVDNAAKSKKKVPAEWRMAYVFAALLHDTGKAGMTDPDPHFKGHAAYSVSKAADFLSRIEAPSDLMRDVINLIRWHHAPFDLTEADLDQWREIQKQVPLRVLAWFSRCDSFAGARRNEPPVLAVHAASERVFRVEKVLETKEAPTS